MFVSLHKPNEPESYNLMLMKCHIPEIYKGSSNTLKKKTEQKRKRPIHTNIFEQPHIIKSFALHSPSHNITTPGFTTTHDVHDHSGPSYSVPKYFCPK